MRIAQVKARWSKILCFSLSGISRAGKGALSQEKCGSPNFCTLRYNLKAVIIIRRLPISNFLFLFFIENIHFVYLWTFVCYFCATMNLGFFLLFRNMALTCEKYSFPEKYSRLFFVLKHLQRFSFSRKFFKSSCSNTYHCTALAAESLPSVTYFNLK